MLSKMTPISEKTLLRSWGLAERSNTERWNALGGHMSQPYQDRPFPSTDQEWEALERAIRQFRSPLLQGLLSPSFKWFRGRLPFGELAKVKVIKYQPFIDAAPSRLLKDFVVVLEESKRIEEPGFMKNVKRLRSDFEIGRMLGEPILVAEQSKGPYYLVEGYSRCCVMLLKHREGTLRVASLRVIIGVGSEVRQWRWY